MKRGGIVTLVALLAVAGVALVLRGGGAAEDCPPGYVDRATHERTEAAFRDEHEIEAACFNRKQPESPKELLLAAHARASRVAPPAGTLRRGAYAAAVRQRAKLRSKLPGSGGTWEPVGRQPLVSDSPDYPEINSLGITDVSGRAGDFALDPATGTLYLAGGIGGVFASHDRGKTWASVGESLPTQAVGAVGFTPADGGTIIALTGDSSYGGTSFSGLGAYRSTDGGRTWSKGTGPPTGVLGFKVAVDPVHPSTVYLGTGAGLWRSTDAGESYENVKLPTSAGCAGTVDAKGCALANMVTDVAVQAPDRFGNAGGAVLAAVGWRYGNKANADGSIQSPGNGLYRSSSGAPGTFAKLAASGFAPQSSIGRTELAVAGGPEQNHDYVYAIVEDAALDRAGEPILDAPDLGIVPLPPIPPNFTVLNGVYVSSDFGSTWLPMTLGPLLAVPTSGSALTPVAALAAQYGPGIQGWYNLAIAVDPTAQAGGIPTRLAFGLEEVWMNEEIGLPLVGPTLFKVVGRYYGGTSCQLLTLPAPACPTNRPPQNSTTTHPDQHALFWLPADGGGVTLLTANDGGVGQQTLAPGQTADNGNWGRGTVKGLDTLQPYDAQIAKDGTVYAGLQDNGEIKITPDGAQTAIFGGDGFYTAVAPDDSNTVYEEYVYGGMNVTVDGGRTWRDVNPELTSPLFSTPFAMDPANAKHLLVAGREVKETTDGPDVGREGKPWRTVFNLGTRDQPGNAGATGIDNAASAVDLRGDNAYVAFCGHCDTIKEGPELSFGLATDVGGAGWHVAAAKGLPKRYITSVTMDPGDPRTVYASLGTYSRTWVKPGSVGEDISQIGSGHVFKSTDAGQTFRDVSGDLPDAPVYKVELRNGQLLAGTEVGPFISADTDGSRWAPLGKGLPSVPVFSIEAKPDDPERIIVATHGRGVWSYRFKDPSGPTACAAAARGFRSVSVRRAGAHGLRFAFKRSASASATVDLLQTATATRSIGTRRIARFTRKRASFTWPGSASLADGIYLARFSIQVGGTRDVRTIPLTLHRGRWAVRGAFRRPDSCTLIRSARLERPEFGGTSHRRLRLSYVVGDRARVSIAVLRGKRVTRTVLGSGARAPGRRYSVAIKPAGLRRGEYRIRITARAGSDTETAVLSARRL